MTHEEAGMEWFLSFSQVQLLELSDKEWDELRRNIVRWLRGGFVESERPFSRSDVGEAQRMVRPILESLALVNGGILERKDVVHPPLEKWVEYSDDSRQNVAAIQFVIQPDGHVYGYFRASNLRALVAYRFALLTANSDITRRVLICDNRDCKRLFLSKREPRRDREAHYCTPRCCHLESTRRLREQPAYRDKERKRSRARYKNKVLKRSRI